jgi:hypothetical protein
MTDNLPEVLAGLNAYKARFDMASADAMSLVARQLYLNAYENADQVANPPERRTSKRSGNSYLHYFPHQGGLGPNRGTGNLLNSMSYSTSRQGFGSYSASAGVGMEYARALEFGSSRWTSGVKYPFMQPALVKLVESGRLNEIIRFAFSKMRG